MCLGTPCYCGLSNGSYSQWTAKGPAERGHVLKHQKSSRADPCSVDFGREAPNSDLNFAVDFWVEFFLLFSPKNPPKNPPQNSPGNLFAKIPSDFCRTLLLKIVKSVKTNFRHFSHWAQNVKKCPPRKDTLHPPSSS